MLLLSYFTLIYINLVGDVKTTKRRLCVRGVFGETSV